MEKLIFLFLTFLEIGAVSFGGGYGMISLIREKVLQYGWLSESDFLNFIAVSESTPGPLAVNMATFIGSSQAGLAGAAAATFGVSAVLCNHFDHRGFDPQLFKVFRRTGIFVGRPSLRRSDDPCYRADNGRQHIARLFLSF